MEGMEGKDAEGTGGEQPPASGAPGPPWGRLGDLIRRAMNGFRSALRSGRRLFASDGGLGRDVRAAFGHLRGRRLGRWGGVMMATVYVLSGVYVVNPGEVAVERLFGRVVRDSVGEGLRYALPWPFVRVDRVNIAEVQREEIGFTLPEHRGLHPAGAKVLALTGDENIVEVELIVQYRLIDPVRALFRVGTRPYLLINDVVRSSVTRIVGGMPVDAILTIGKEEVQRLIREDAQRRLDAYESGVRLVTVNAQKLYPPDAVADAFRDVASAGEDRARTISQAQGVRNSVIPEARGEAERLLREAEAYRVETLSRARGEAGAFLAALREYRQAGAEVTRQRLYVETMERILPRVKKYVVGPSNTGKVQLRVLEGKPPVAR